MADGIGKEKSIGGLGLVKERERGGTGNGREEIRIKGEKERKNRVDIQTENGVNGFWIAWKE